MVSCKSCARSRSSDTLRQGITFHSFPRDKQLFEIWKNFIKDPKTTVTKDSHLCSLHFNKNCLYVTDQGKVRLYPGTVPVYHVQRKTNLKNETSSIRDLLGEVIDGILQSYHQPSEDKQVKETNGPVEEPKPSLLKDITLVTTQPKSFQEEYIRGISNNIRKVLPTPKIEECKQAPVTKTRRRKYVNKILSIPPPSQAPIVTTNIGNQNISSESTQTTSQTLPKQQEENANINTLKAPENLNLINGTFPKLLLVQPANSEGQRKIFLLKPPGNQVLVPSQSINLQTFSNPTENSPAEEPQAQSSTNSLPVSSQNKIIFIKGPLLQQTETSSNVSLQVQTSKAIPSNNINNNSSKVLTAKIVKPNKLHCNKFTWVKKPPNASQDSKRYDELKLTKELKYYQSLVEKIKQNNRKRAKTAKKLNQKLYYQKRKIASLQKTVKELHENLERYDEQKQFVTEIFNNNTSLALGLLNKNLYNTFFMPDEREFALTLFRYSPKAYDYVRSHLIKYLPHRQTIFKWLRAINSVKNSPSNGVEEEEEFHEVEEEESNEVEEEEEFNGFEEEESQEVPEEESNGVEVEESNEEQEFNEVAEEESNELVPQEETPELHETEEMQFEEQPGELVEEVVVEFEDESLQAAYASFPNDESQDMDVGLPKETENTDLVENIQDSFEDMSSILDPNLEFETITIEC